jgi:AcrR family transcriptional regulator
MAVADPAAGFDAGEVDGRRLRREQNREAVLDALVALFHEGIYQPSTNDIAERAGISPRSVFRYFEDVDDLNRAAIERQLSKARPLLDVGVDPGTATRAKIARVVEARVHLYETIAPAARAARVSAHRHAVVAAQVDESRRYLRNQLRRLFAPELQDHRATRFPAIDALCAFETYELLRTDQGLSRAKIVAALTDALSALLDA